MSTVTFACPHCAGLIEQEIKGTKVIKDIRGKKEFLMYLDHKDIKVRL